MKTLRIKNIWNFATFNLYTVSAKILYLQRYSTDFRNLSLCSEMLRVGIWVESFLCAGILRLKMARWKICKSTTFEILQLSTCTLRQPKYYISKGIHPIFEIFASARRCWGWAFGWKFQLWRYFTFPMARWKLCASTTFEILPLSTCALFQQKSYISKGTQQIFEIFASARRCWGWAFGWKI